MFVVLKVYYIQRNYDFYCYITSIIIMTFIVENFTNIIKLFCRYLQVGIVTVFSVTEKLTVISNPISHKNSQKIRSASQIPLHSAR